MENIRGDEFRAGFRVVLDRETKNPHVVHHPPPLTAIDRFLLSSSSSEKQISPTELCGSSSTTINSFGGAVDGNGYLSLPSLTDISFVDGLLVDGNSDNFRNDGHKMKKISKRLPESSLSMPTSPIFIKGQWTDGEDRLLVRLVKQYGERKWAQIAHKLGGRAGKQCRERWHNHLRPDIKKDTWSEEEERLLVETHQKVGNRWAEIAKRIPGRTENSIKNHWNATKRRLNSRRKNNKRTAAKSKASFLQSYINGSCIKENILSSSSSSTTTTLAITEPPNGIFLNSSNQLSSVLHPEPSSDSSFTDDSPLTLVAQTHDDELLFIQKFFEDIYSKQQLVSSSLVHNKTQIGHENTPTYDYGYGHRNSSVFDIDSSSLQTLKYGDPPAMGIYNDHEFMVNVSSTSPSTDFTNFYTANNTIQDAHDYSGGSTESCSINSCSTTNSSTHVNSDLYISYLLNEVGSFSSSNNNTSESQCYHGHPDSFMDYLWTDGRGSYHTPMKRDMDLIEMVSFSNYSGSHD
ncbi:transcription factor MYB119-like [Papaver somniferum]|uniref:transcription factor MYB119-like n=1 Tax=Papaver somniferum TaxID=3469 RepID=UPI000E705FF4|nr:transcription factor MYB119-like [Papaver somniferum]